ncbi:LacI family DNA-binding transcriptional regulator [Armatimonas sp.]|uniref:LacI family DNA-binding transcriptional regulator n=1 Tax=Armatimonas sp. TaxID=1872638 RepID=UPI00286A928B|nr:LacI family DNA-binding transcriptional regulator [Armatimonas sp.]
MARRLPTIRDVAAQAGVSVGTASKALNNQGRISTETRAAVVRAAEELRFAPNALIRSLQRGRTGTVGLLTWPVRETGILSVDLALLTGVSHGLAAVQTDMLLYARCEGRDLGTVLLDGRVDGAILVPHELEETTLESLSRAGLPTVTLYQAEVPHGVGFVRVDNASGIRQAIAHLVALGHRRIAFYSPLTSADFHERCAAYREFCRELGISTDVELCVTPDEYYAPLLPTWQKWQALDAPPTALIAGNDGFAIMWLEFLEQQTVRVPQDLSLIGFDDAPIASSGASLTTVRQPGLQVGELAATFVDRLIHGAPAEECRRTLPVELIVRETTGPVPQKQP